MATKTSQPYLKSWPQAFGTPEIPSLAFLELSSISRGLVLTDLVLKKAPVKIITSQPVSSGKHVILFFGDVAEVEESFQEAIEHSQNFLLKQVFIPSVHEKLVPYLDSIWEKDGFTGSVQDSVGVVESSTLAGAILSADHALKTAEISLCRMRLGQGIGGKAYFVLTGRQEDVEAALEAAHEYLKQMESLVRVDIIPRPQTEALAYF